MYKHHLYPLFLIWSASVFMMSWENATATSWWHWWPPLIGTQMSLPGAPVIAVLLVPTSMMPPAPPMPGIRTTWPTSWSPLSEWQRCLSSRLNRPCCHSLGDFGPAYILNWSQIVAHKAETLGSLSLNSRLFSFESFGLLQLQRHRSWGSYMLPRLGKCALFLRPFPI